MENTAAEVEKHFFRARFLSDYLLLFILLRVNSLFDGLSNCFHEGLDCRVGGFVVGR